MEDENDVDELFATNQTKVTCNFAALLEKYSENVKSDIVDLRNFNVVKSRGRITEQAPTVLFGCAPLWHEVESGEASDEMFFKGLPLPSFADNVSDDDDDDDEDEDEDDDEEEEEEEEDDEASSSFVHQVILRTRMANAVLQKSRSLADEGLIGSDPPTGVPAVANKLPLPLQQSVAAALARAELLHRQQSSASSPVLPPPLSSATVRSRSSVATSCTADLGASTQAAVAADAGVADEETATAVRVPAAGRVQCTLRSASPPYRDSARSSSGSAVAVAPSAGAAARCSKTDADDATVPAAAAATAPTVVLWTAPLRADVAPPRPLCSGSDVASPPSARCAAVAAHHPPAATASTACRAQPAADGTGSLRSADVDLHAPPAKRTFRLKTLSADDRQRLLQLQRNMATTTTKTSVPTTPSGGGGGGVSLRDGGGQPTDRTLPCAPSPHPASSSCTPGDPASANAQIVAMAAMLKSGKLACNLTPDVLRRLAPIHRRLAPVHRSLQ